VLSACFFLWPNINFYVDSPFSRKHGLHVIEWIIPLLLFSSLAKSVRLEDERGEGRFY